MKATRKKLQGEGHEEKATSRRPREEKKLLYKEKATRRKLQGEGDEEIAT